MLSHSPAGALTLYDPTGEIPLDTTHTRPVPDASANFFCPGMFVLLEGIYEDSGTFTVFTIASPPPERRDVSAEIFGHIDFLGNGISLDMSTPTRSGGGQLGRVLRQTELSLSHVRWVALGELDLTSPRTLEALRHVFTRYESALITPAPMLWILGGNFIPTPVYPSGEGSRTYKTAFDSLAALLDDFTRILSNSTWVFVPGDNDPWASTFSGGSSTAWPRSKMPEVFLNRVKRVITKGGGDVRCVSSPCRLGYFTSEVVLCRDDIVSRFRRNMVRFSQPPQEEMDVDGGDADTPVESEGGGKEVAEVDPDTALARKLVKTVLDQGSLSPFALNKRPVLWDFAYTVGLYPLPSAVSPPPPPPKKKLKN
jgi:DNA polymerase epsilon subunit 2